MDQPMAEHAKSARATKTGHDHSARYGTTKTFVFVVPYLAEAHRLVSQHPALEPTVCTLRGDESDLL